MYPEKEKNNSMDRNDRIAILRGKIDRLKAMIIVEKKLFLKEDLRARKMEME